MSRGFTLVEVLLSVAIIGILVGLSAPIYAGFQTRNEMAIQTQTVAELLRRANTYAWAIKDDSAWGVHVSGSAATLFKGTTYATRDTAADEATPMPAGIVANGLTEVVFAKSSGVTAHTGTITLTASSTNDTRAITVNAKGMVTY